ncbi:MAG: 3-hydroxyanthranilate 3,4-dioxygenase [Phycisphaerales bacterium]|nr:3-hydroxyanthranilate 3,4-dioxygenase [Phycisphaerales bacterium]
MRKNRSFEVVSGRVSFRLGLMPLMVSDSPAVSCDASATITEHGTGGTEKAPRTSAGKELPMATTTSVKVMAPINIERWVEEHRHLLKPPVGNQYLYDGDDFFVMVIGGPNARNDFHLTDSEEYFYQFKGDIVVTIRDADGLRDVPVREGETFFIPGGIPHSPQRQPDTIGIVVERRRPAGETEHQQFYCHNCGELVYDKEFDCKDIVEHFAQSMEDFWADDSLNKCGNCGTRITKPAPITSITFEPEITITRG